MTRTIELWMHEEEADHSPFLTSDSDTDAAWCEDCGQALVRKPDRHPRAHYRMTLRGGRKIDILPTPLLLDQIARRDLEVYEHKPASDQYPPIWRVRDDGFDQPGIEYQIATMVDRID